MVLNRRTTPILMVLLAIKMVANNFFGTFQKLGYHSCLSMSCFPSMVIDIGRGKTKEGHLCAGNQGGTYQQATPKGQI